MHGKRFGITRISPTSPSARSPGSAPVGYELALRAATHYLAAARKYSRK